MIRRHYETNCDQYVLHHDGKPVGRLLDEVAIAYALDEEDGIYILHQHGSVEAVNQWAQTKRDQLNASGDPLCKQMADDIKIIQGQFDLKDLNAVLENDQKIGLLLSKMNALQLDGVEIIEADAPSPKGIRARQGADIEDVEDVSVKPAVPAGAQRLRFRSR